MPGIPCQKNFNETPNAIEGTMIGMLMRLSRIADGALPKVLRAISIAIGMPRTNAKHCDYGS